MRVCRGFLRESGRGFERELAEDLRESGRGFELCGVSDIVTGQMRCAPGTMPPLAASPCACYAFNLFFSAFAGFVGIDSDISRLSTG